MERLRAGPDPRLQARVRARRALCYAAGPDPAQDRPAHVRAGSGLAWVRGRLLVLQDDARFLARLDPAGGPVEALPLPPGPGGRRLFGDDRGNKALKLDLEACLVACLEGQEVLVAFGSGSRPARERVLMVRGPLDPAPQVEELSAPALYAALRGEVAFAGSELNLEGAVLLPDGNVRLFQRGNGAPQGGRTPVDASCDLDGPGLWRHLRDPEAWPTPCPRRIRPYDLGELAGVRLTFTDAALASGGSVLFLAGAEASPDAYRDGEVVGSVLGVLAPDGSGRWTPLLGPDGVPLRDKVEGLALDPVQPRRAWAVVDADDASLPCDLLELELLGPWA